MIFIDQATFIKIKQYKKKIREAKGKLKYLKGANPEKEKNLQTKILIYKAQIALLKQSYNPITAAFANLSKE